MIPKILLLQARHTNDTARLDERRSFAHRAGIDEKYIVPHDLLTSVPTFSQVKRYDALMVGGSGEYYVSKANLPEFPAVLDLLAEVVADGHPTFASCFGFQLMVKALGGEIVYDPENMEVGTYALHLTEFGMTDELFDYLPPIFQAQLGHKDRASHLPEGVLNLAGSQNSPYQALRVPGKPIWATQFHPELTGAENLKRFRQYLDGYAAMLGPEELQATLDGFGDSPETDLLIGRFLKIIIN